MSEDKVVGNSDGEQKLLDYLKKVTGDLRQAHRRLRDLEAANNEPIAVIGMSCRFPGDVRTPEDLWELLADGGDGMGAFPVDRGWDLEALYNADHTQAGTSYTRVGGFVHDATTFDAGFFGMSPREAMAMDPQQRMLLQASWEAFEHAGIDPHGLKNTDTGVFVGAASTGYGTHLTALPEGVEGYMLTGNSMAVASGRIAYTLGLKGPAATIDTACSSSLVALHMAVQALRSGDCSLALVGGVTVMSTPGMFLEFSRQQGLATDGRCKAFSDDADGTGWSEGVGLIVLGKLSDARKHGHRVLAVVKGSAINQDGASNGLTVPNGPSQQGVISQALAGAGLKASEVDAVEAHGTGTSLGDPIEAHALLATYGQDREADRPLWLGSVKSNIGHTQAAAGVAGVMKMILALQHEQLPKSLYVGTPSTHVDWSAGAVELLAESRPWTRTDERPRRAGVSSFGISGTNAHVIIEEPPAEEPAEQDGAAVPPPVVPWLLTARQPEALPRLAARLRTSLAARPDTAPAAVGRTLATHRAVFEQRAVVLATDTDSALAQLDALAGDKPSPHVLRGTAARGGGRARGRTAFVFSGQGGQRAGMGRELAAVFPVFAEALGEVCAHFEGLREVMFEDVDGVLRQTGWAQPALFAVEVALFRLAESWGVKPDYLAGHSVGELAAAHVAGVLSLADACALVKARASLMQALPEGGAMWAVRATPEEVEPHLVEGVSVAAVNAPGQVVVSGAREAVEQVAAVLGEGRQSRWLEVSHAFHSVLMDPMLEDFRRVAAGVSFHPAQTPIVSTLTGERIREFTADYWVDQVRGTVRFADATARLRADGVTRCIELGPDASLVGAIGETCEDDVLAVAALHRDKPEAQAVLAAVSRLWTHGLRVDWDAFFAPSGAETVDLPTYPFARDRYWMENPEGAQHTSRAAGHPADAELWNALENADAESFAAELGLGAESSLREALPALSAWQKQRRARAEVDRLRYEISWRSVVTEEAGDVSGGWLIVQAQGPEEPWADALADALAARGAQVSRLDVATGTASRGELADRLGAFADCGRVVSFLGQAESEQRGPASTMVLVQALADAGSDARLWAVTSGAVAGGPGETVTHPVRAGVWGLGRVVALEEPDRWGGLVDVPDVPEKAAVGRLVEVLAGGAGEEDQLAVRGSAVLGRRLAPAREAEQVWVPSGTVLVTGGTGALGARVARWVLERGAEGVVLVSRRGMDAPGANELHARLTEFGAVDVVACDVGDPAQVEDVFGRFEVSAVVHCAGVLDDGVVDGLTADRLAGVWSGKAGAAWNLHRVTEDRELDAFVLFSSAAGVWGGAGQGSYAAANAALDALADHRRARGLPAASVAWGPWAEGGMAAQDVVQARAERGGLTPLDPEIAVGLLDSVDGCVTVADVDWTTFVPAATALRPNTLWKELAPAAAAPAAPRAAGGLAERLAGASATARRSTVTELVRGQVAAVLGFADPSAVELGVAFRELGFDSLTAVELRNALTAASGLKLPSTLVFDYPTVEALAGHLLGELSGEIADSAEAPVTATAVTGDDPVVVVGMGCRFPGGVDSPDGLWTLLADGVDAMGPFPLDRGWELDPHLGSGFVPVGGFLDGATDFDAGLFGISPREALAMDPQQRVLLEVAWDSLERAGIAPLSLRGTPVGVFVGTNGQDYGALLAASAESVEGYGATGNSGSVLSGRVSYVLGLEGPAVTVDTACSASLVALHQAAHALRSGECSLALAGGVTVMSTPGAFAEFAAQSGLAGDGRCKAFSDDADGTGWGEGAGVLVLERLSDARRNGHHVLATVRGSAVNQDGASNGLTAPNGPSQQRVIRQALAQAGVRASEVDAVEAHGTGTSLGDPIEAQALLATYGKDREADRPLWLGSVKSNLGHTQAAAGVAGVMKMILALRHETLPKSLHIGEPSSHVDWSSGAVRLLADARDWPGTDGPRLAGVSSFGVSGTNAHVIIGGAPVAPDEAQSAADGPAAELPVLPWLVSAKTAGGVASQAARLLSAVDGRPGADVGLTLATARSGLDHRAAVMGEDAAELRHGLAALAAGEPAPGLVSGQPVDGLTGFVFSGQGGQRAGMGRELSEAFPVFAEALGEVCAHFDGLRAVMFEDPDGVLKQTGWAQPALFAVEVALFRLVTSWGVKPDYLVGHSVGELAAAHVAGVLSLADACALVKARASLMQALPEGGAMWAVRATPEEVAPHLVEGVSVAAVNAPGQVVVSGAREVVEQVAGALPELDGRWLEVSHAFHSALMDPMLDAFRRAAAGTAFRRPDVPIVSTLTGDLVEEFTADYWVDQVRGTVRFADATARARALGVSRFLELGPDASLVGAIGEACEDGAVAVALLRREKPEPRTAVTALARFWAHGGTVDWAAYFAPTGAHATALPTYAFQRQRYWPQFAVAASAAGGADGTFWEAVESADAERFAAEFGIDLEAPLRDTLPALSAWQQRRRERAAVDRLRYEVSWSPVGLTAGTVVSGDWLIVERDGSDDPWAAALGEELARRGAKAASMRLTAADLERAPLAERLREAGHCTHIVSFLGQEEPEQGGPASTMLLVQALADAGSDARLWAVTSGAVFAGPGDAVAHPERAGVWGLGRVVALEEPGRWGGLVDVPEAPEKGAVGRLAEVLAGAAPGEDQVAVRGGAVLGRRLAPAREAEQVWSPSGTVLVTGGTGALGARVARWVLERGAEGVVLVSRRGMDAPGAAELRDELTPLGRVDVVACDVGDPAQVKDLFGRFDVSAVVHCAGVLDDGVVDGLTADRLAGVWAGKAGAAWNLHRAAEGRELDAFVLFSSAAGVWGGAGQGSYAAANAALDALVEHRRAQGLTAAALAWGPWAEGGMAAADVVQARVARGGVTPLDPDVAVGVLESASGCVTVADVDWAAFVPAATALRPNALWERIAPAHTRAPAGPAAAAEGGLRARLASAAPTARKGIVTDVVRGQVAAVLGFADASAVELGVAFRDLGFDSLTAVELRNALTAETGLKLPSTLVFDYPTTLGLAEFLLGELGADSAGGGRDADGDLDRLEATLLALPASEVSRMKVTARLQQLMKRLDAAADADGGPDVSAKIEAATADDIFDLIDNEIGTR
ncbi:SDR family NAD(P)-dependent oxidoreductase [Streptomyces sp. DSM 42041]|uniref:SDR family NAD(P)-dependent oxidoreductase n=1 Tax=Streptomyces hazeniae TaxID=3075538 RepID=A0ABU2NL85_9ACTN|nr:SDR family NAD(P)-dependent oxidoreductase [Streptomyces sp. DSM 42041]MDT0377683.1 SDR family NAD(P)-dependent oxidoreductase [Streptomyces sp. DSM 42041]